MSKNGQSVILPLHALIKLPCGAGSNSASKMEPMNRRHHHAVSVLDAASDSPTLARLSALAAESRQRLDSIGPLLPAAMRQSIKPGPINGDDWCLIASDSSAAAKLRQLVPALCAHLRKQGSDVKSIRVKVRKTAL